MGHAFDLASRVILVTGGATGIGLATVRAFASQGGHVVFTDIISAHGPGVAADLADRGFRCRFVQSDATDEAQIEALIAEILREYGRLDIAVNVVGGTGRGDRSGLLIHETPLDAYQATLDLNLRSAFLCMKHQVAPMLRQGGGVIANTTSMAGLRITPYASPAYHAAKAGLVHLTQKVAFDYAAKNIRANVVAPGITASEQMVAKRAPEQLAEMVRAWHPMGSIVRPEDVADAFLWLCSDKASLVTGLTIPVAGGWPVR